MPGPSETFGLWGVKFFGDTSGLKIDIERAVGMVGRGVGSMAGTLFNLKTAVLGLVGAGGFVALFKSAVNTGEEMAKLSQRVAIGVETLSGYKLAASLAEVSMDEFARALQFASKNMLAATQGTSLAGKAFQDMGIHLTDSSGKMRSVEAIMLDVADRFSKMEDGAKKTGYAMEIFGRGGARMIPMLNQGRAALEGQRKEAELLGATFTTQGAKAAEEFNENLKRLEAGFTGLRNTVTQALLPFFNEIVGGIIGKMKEWAASGDLRKWAKETSDFIIDAFVAVAHFLDENLVSAVEMATRGFLVMKLAVEGLANGVLVLTNGILGLVWVINEGGLGIRKLLGIQESLGVTTEQVERRVDRVTGMIAENSARIADFSKDINEALSTLWSGEGAGMSDAMKARITGVAETISSAALKIKS